MSAYRNGKLSFSSNRQRARMQADRLFTALAIGCTFVVILPLFAVLIYLVLRGASSLSWAFFTQLPRPISRGGGGMANAIVGSGLILGVSSLIGIPVGIGAGVFLAEYGAGRPIATFIRFTADVLNGVPSIVIGIAVYALIVVPTKSFSALAGGIALAIMMVPTVTRTTEEMLATVPHSVREAALGLGIPKWRTTLSVTLRTASSGIITGCMLAFARVAGETAPLLFTAFGSQFWPRSLTEQTAALPLQIFNYAMSPYDEWRRLAWAGALVLILLIMVSVTLVRYVAARGTLRGGH